MKTKKILLIILTFSSLGLCAQTPKVNCNNVRYFADTIYISPANNIVGDTIYYNDTLELAYPNHCLVISDTSIISTKIGTSDGCNFFTGLSSFSYDDTVYIEYPINFKTTNFANNTMVNGYFNLLRVSSNDTIADCYYPVVIILQNATGILEAEKTIQNIYPNPTTGKFRVIAKGVKQSQIQKIEVYNLLGEVIYTSPITQLSSLEIDLSNQPNGVYFLKCKTENENQILKIVKQ